MVEIKGKPNEKNFRVFDVVELISGNGSGNIGIITGIIDNILTVSFILDNGSRCNIERWHYSHLRKSDKEITFKN